MRLMLAMWLGLAAGSVSLAAEPVKVIFGFEEAAARKLGAKGEGDELRWQVSQYKVQWFRKGDVTQGEWALAAMRGQFLKSGKTRYSILRRQAVLNTFGWFRRLIPSDWSGYDRLRLDFKSVNEAGRVRVEIEDVLCQPMVRRTFAFPAGKWVALELDLAEASKLHEVRLGTRRAERLGVESFKGRVLNPAKMANIYVYLEQLDGKSTILLDNLRLLAKDAREEAERPVLRDDSPLLTPRALPDTEPTPAALPDGFEPAPAPDRPVIREVDLSKAGKTGYGRLRGITRRGLAAADGRRMLIAFLAGYVHVLRTVDGGKTWAGLDGRPKPTRCYHSANAPSHCASAAGPDLLYAYTDRCSGGRNPSNMFFRLIRFKGSGWELGPPRLLDVDCRHCPEWKVRLLRIPSGRIWASWMHQDRFGELSVRARYSDDEGRTWRDPDSNAMVIVNRDNSQGPQRYGATLWVEEPKELMPPLPKANGRLGKMYSRGQAVVVRYGEHVACVWARSWHPNAVWSVFDGRAWSEPKKMGRGSPGSAVTVGKHDVYVTLHDKRKARLLHLVGGKWEDDSPPEGRPGLLSVCGETLYTFWTKKEGKKVAVYEAHKRGGEWSGPRRLALEAVPGEGPKARLSLVAPATAPAGFVPLAWGPHHEWIKMTALPAR
ncbi:MAG: sialidase family protein [Planctomycetota bacterium]